MADQPAKKSKRRVKDPETFRERALKAVESGAKPERRKRLRAGSRVAGLFRPITQSLTKLFGHKAFKPVKIALRFIAKIIFIGYLARSWQELRQVTWPSRRESRRLTVAVLIFAIVFGAAVAGVDWGLDKVFKHLLLK